MAKNVKNEHYVPRRYLKHFAQNKAFYVFDKEKKQARPGSIEDYACERYFYDIDFEALKADKLKRDPDFAFAPEIEKFMETVDEQHIEKWLGDNVENKLFDPIEKIITASVMVNPQKIETIEVLGENDLNNLALYIAIQIVRSKEFRNFLVEMNERVPLLLMTKAAMQHKDKSKLEQLIDVQLKIPSKNYEKLLHAQFLMDDEFIAHIAALLRNKIWVIGYNQTEEDFITSDNPVVRYGREQKHGLNSIGIEIMFPISPKLIICIRDPKYFLFDAYSHKHFVKVDANEVDYYNSFQVLQSYRYVFSKNSKFDKVSDIIKCRPELSDINRNKILMK